MVIIQLFELFGSVLLKDDGVSSKLDSIDKKASGTSKGMGISFGSIASAALKVGAIIGAGLGIKTMIETAAKGQDRLAQMSAVLKSTGGACGMTKDELVKLATAQSHLSTNSKGVNMETENLLLTFTSLGKDIFPQCLTTVNDMSQALGKDTKSSAIMLGKALQDPVKGVTALTKAGVNLTEQQKDQIKTLVESGHTMEAQKLILAELGKEFGGSALAASKTFDGQMIILKNSLAGVGVSIANTVMPYLTQFLTWINDHMPQIQQFITNAMKAITDAFKTVSDFITKNVVPAFDSFWKWIQPYMPAIREMVKGVSDAIKAVLKVVADYITQVVIPGYAALAKWFFDNWPKIKDAVMKAYEYIKPAFDRLVQTVKENLMPILLALWDTFKKALPGIQAIFEIVFPILVWLIKLVINIISDFIIIVGKIYGFIKPGLDLVATIFSVVFGGIVRVIQAAQAVLDFFNGTSIKDKQATVTTHFLETHSSSTSSGGAIGMSNAAGTDYFGGGLTHINELGGEIVDLPRGSRIIPHDVSMEMAKNGDKGLTQTVIFNGTYSFAEQKDIDYFMNQAAVLVQRRAG
jgi:phage-related protein